MPRRRIYLQEPKSVELTALCVEEKNVQKLFCAPKENHFSNRSMIMLHGYICMLIYSFEILKNSKKTNQALLMTTSGLLCPSTSAAVLSEVMLSLGVSAALRLALVAMLLCGLF